MDGARTALLSRPRERIASSARESSVEKGRVVKRASILGSPVAGQGPATSLRIRIALMSETTEIPLSFEAALTELENLVGRMESGDLPLQESLAVYKRGAELLAYCQNALKDAELQVQVLEKGLLQPFQPDDGNNG